MSEQENNAKTPRHSHPLLIPAGVLLGVGIGLMLGYPAEGVIVGLGFGFLATAYMRSNISSCSSSSRWIMAIIGLFMILLGLGFVWAPRDLWPYLFGLFLIVIGLGFLVKNFRAG